VSSPPRPHLREQGHELDRRLGEAVDPLLGVIGVRAPRQQLGRPQTLEPIGEDVRRDPLLAVLEQRAVGAPVPEHHVADDDQAPTIAELLERQVDRAARSPRVRHRWFSSDHLQYASFPSIVQPLAKCK
jgi:hypothetical protein